MARSVIRISREAHTTVHELSWVVGRRGLLGSAVIRELAFRGGDPVTTRVQWDGHGSVHALDAFARSLQERDAPWRLIWCAGAGVVATAPAALQQEVDLVQAFFERLADRISANPSGSPTSIFVASSAGGVYAGSANPPYDENSIPSADSAYGKAKLSIERHAHTFHEHTGVPLLVGRIANLYGPGQDLGKAQGLISRLCLSHITRQPLAIYVPLDSARDYLYVRDCARMMLDGLDQVRRVGGAHMKILASQQSTTIAAILGELRRVSRRKPVVVLGTHPLAHLQSRDLRFRSLVMTGIDRHASTTLATGVAATLESLHALHRRGELHI